MVDSTEDYLLLAALVASAFHAGQTTTLGVWRGIGSPVVVEVVVMVVVMVLVEEAGRAAVQGAPFALGRAAAGVERLTSHAGGKVRGLHGRPEPAAPGGWGKQTTV
jgi:hypothetical protein